MGFNSCFVIAKYWNYIFSAETKLQCFSPKYYQNMVGERMSLCQPSVEKCCLQPYLGCKNGGESKSVWGGFKLKSHRL